MGSNKQGDSKDSDWKINFIACVILWILYIWYQVYKDWLDSNNITKNNTKNSVQSSIISDNVKTSWSDSSKNKILKLLADPEATILFMGLMIKESWGNSKLQDLILTKSCVEFSKLYSSESRTMTMTDWTRITKLDPINSPKKSDTIETYVPHYDPKIEESAGNCVKSLINNWLINLNKIGDDKLVEKLKYKEI